MIMAVEKARKINRPTSLQCMDRQADPMEVAQLIAFLLSDEASFITGSIQCVDGGWTCELSEVLEGMLETSLWMDEAT